MSDVKASIVEIIFFGLVEILWIKYDEVLSTVISIYGLLMYLREFMQIRIEKLCERTFITLN